MVPCMQIFVIWFPGMRQNMRPNRVCHWKSSIITVLFGNTAIGFSENLFLVKDMLMTRKEMLRV